MRTRPILSAIMGLSVCYTSSLGEIQYNHGRVQGVHASVESSTYLQARGPATLYEHALATLNAQGLAEIEVSRVYSASVMTSLLLKAESALRQAVSQMGIGPVLAIQEQSIQGFRAKMIEDLLKP